MEKKLSEMLEALLLSASRPISVDDMVKVFEDPKPSKDEIRSVKITTFSMPWANSYFLNRSYQNNFQQFSCHLFPSFLFQKI